MTEIKKRVPWTQEEDQILRDNYGKADPVTLTQLIPNHSRSSIRNRATYLRNHGDLEIADKQEKRKYAVNFDFFNEVGLEQCAFAGLVASDGCIIPSKNRIQVTSRDTDYLSEWAKQVGYTGNVYTYDNHKTAFGSGSTSILMISGVPLWLRALRKFFNITPRKSLTLFPPNINKKEHVLSFMSGYIDGDGSIMYKTSYTKKYDKHYSEWCVAFCGTEAMCYWFKLQCDTLYPSTRLYKGMERKKDKRIWQFRIYGKRALKLMNDMLLLDIPRLSRKWDPVISYLQSNPLP
jgi:hypothetical protein